MKPLGQEYLGDGVDASVERGMIVLRANRIAADEDDPNVVYLEPEVLLALVAFARSQGLVIK